MKKPFIILAFTIIVGLAAIGTAMYVTFNNKDVSLKNAVTAKLDERSAHFTKMWNVIKQKANISDEYAKQFKEIYPELIAGRYNNGGGEMMQWIVEHNPNFDSSLYKDLMRSVEAERASFFVTQQHLIDIDREHANLHEKIPSKWFTDTSNRVSFKIIENQQARDATATGIEPEMQLF